MQQQRCGSPWVCVIGVFLAFSFSARPALAQGVTTGGRGRPWLLSDGGPPAFGDHV
jgi:hypothetical protein